MGTSESAELRIRIAKYRAMARLTTDQETAKRIHDLADELQVRVRELEQQPPAPGISSAGSN